jgi:hypothetical protein
MRYGEPRFIVNQEHALDDESANRNSCLLLSGWFCLPLIEVLILLYASTKNNSTTY